MRPLVSLDRLAQESAVHADIRARDKAARLRAGGEHDRTGQFLAVAESFRLREARANDTPAA